MKPPESFLPNFCSLPNAFMLVLSSLLLAFVLTLADFSPGHGFWSDLGLRSFFIIWVALPSGAVLCGLQSRLARFGAVGGGIAVFCVVQTVTMTVAVVAQTCLAGIGYGLPGAESAALANLRILAVSSLVTAAWLRYQYIQACLRLQSRAEVSARLDALQARMQPHFLFNTLNTIAGLIRESPAAAEELLLDMAEVLRAILKKDDRMVPLSEEVGLTRQYLHIEQQRLGERLNVAWDLERVPQDALIPPLSLQPLVENAIRHGIDTSPEGGRVGISGRFTRKGLVLTVSNTVPEAAARRARPGARQALSNLRARLDACFHGRGRLYMSMADGRYQARIVIPYLAHGHESTDC
jgi:two-component system sensor histidine kinase AlgZ